MHRAFAPLALLVGFAAAEPARAAAPFLNIAHRGASAYAPEHTLEAYRLALEQGADYVEQDLAVTKDGALVCIHDLTLERTTNVEEVFPDRAVTEGGSTAVRHWRVHDFTLAEIKRLDAGSWFDKKFTGARIPTFQEAVDLLKGKAGLYPEDVALCVLAMRLGRAVKWVEQRREAMQASAHARDHHYAVRAGFDAAGEYRDVRFTVSDGIHTITRSVTFSVLPVNSVPVLNGIPDRVVRQGDALRFTLAATDADDDAVRYGAAALLPGMFLDPSTGVFEWMPPFDLSGSFDVRFRASDGAGDATRLLELARVDLHHRREEPERAIALALERVPADDRPEPTAVADAAVLLVERLVVLARGAAREDHDALAVERRLDDVADALGQRADGHGTLTDARDEPCRGLADGRQRRIGAGAVVGEDDDRIIGHSDRQHFPFIVPFLDDEVVDADVDRRPARAIDGGGEHHSAGDVLCGSGGCESYQNGDHDEPKQPDRMQMESSQVKPLLSICDTKVSKHRQIH